MTSKVRVDIASPPDREKLVAQIVVGPEQLAEVSHEQGHLNIEIYPQQNGRPWALEFDVIVKALEEARRKLGH